MNKDEQERMVVLLELRNLHEQVKAGNIRAADAKSRLALLRAKKGEIEKRMALAKVKPADEVRASFAEVKKALIEKRAITLNGTGFINQVREIAKEVQARTPILQGVRYFYGPNAQTNIPVLSPTIATPGNYAEGATAISADSQAQLIGKTITPYAYVSLLPVSAETITLGSVNIESELPVIFGDAFAQAFHGGILTGDGTGRNFKGLFPAVLSSNKIECAATGAPKVADLVKLALTVQDLTDDCIIVMSPGIYSQIMADATTGVADLYKEELIRTKTIEGVKIILTSGAPASITGGSLVAIAGRLIDYGVGLASEITIEPIKKVGDTNTYFQATVFANGIPIVPKNFFGLATKSVG
ncbi:MAG: phage major capsid protein [Treponema sp.]|jgi:HK97 family phage major capsid protein|nr:phage major capsid protein [Treponema sp.]